MGKFTEICIDEIIARTKVQLRVDNTTEHDAYFSLMIYEAVRHLGNLSLFKKKQCDLPIVDRKSKLPNDFYKLVALRATGTNTFSPNSIKNNNPFLVGNTSCVTQLYVDKDFLNDCGCEADVANPSVNFNNGYQIQAGWIYWNSSFPAINATLAYMAMNMNEEGRLMIYEDYERAVSNYACYQFTLSYPDIYKEATIERYKREWMAQKSWVRGINAASQFQENKREVSALFNSLLVSPLVNVAH